MAPKRAAPGAPEEDDNPAKRQDVDASTVEVGAACPPAPLPRRRQATVANHRRAAARPPPCCRPQALVPETALHDVLDEELDTSGIPVGWRQCPRMGAPVWRLIPMKVPLDSKFDRHVAPEDRFTVDQAKAMADAMLAGLPPPPEGAPAASCSLVIDLTNSGRYYDVRRWQELGVHHVKVRCCWAAGLCAVGDVYTLWVHTLWTSWRARIGPAWLRAALPLPPPLTPPAAAAAAAHARAAAQPRAGRGARRAGGQRLCVGGDVPPAR